MTDHCLASGRGECDNMSAPGGNRSHGEMYRAIESSAAGYAPRETESATHGDLLPMDNGALGSRLIALMREDHP